MPDDAYLSVGESLVIPRGELHYRATAAGGPGGQHVNRSSTRIELLWDLPHSLAVTDDLRERLQAKLESRLDSQGRVRVVASERRSQLQNKLAAEAKLVALIRQALHVPKRRRPTRPTKSSVERRLDEKRVRAKRKRERGWRDD